MNNNTSTATWEHVLAVLTANGIQTAIDDDPGLSPQAIAQAVVQGAIDSGCTSPKALQEAIDSIQESLRNG
jgi:hypothetical protein